MSFVQLLLKARKVEKARLDYVDEKFTSIEIFQGEKSKLSLRQKLRRSKLRCKKKCREFLKNFTFPEDSWMHKKLLLLRTDGSLENYILKSIVGFIGGIFLTYLFFIFFVFQLNFTLSGATLLCSIIGIILTLGLAFSYRVRCFVFLLLPQFFSTRGRQALMGYALILALTGPAKNTLHNIGVLTESLACGQEQLKDAVKGIIDLVKRPFVALKAAITKVVEEVKNVVEQIKSVLVAIRRLVLSISQVLKSVFEWLGSVVSICNKKLGTPWDRCVKVFDGAVADCKAKLGPTMGVVCNLAYVVGAVCLPLKPMDFICFLISYATDGILDEVRTKIRKFTKQMKAMFYVQVKFSHSYEMQTNQSKKFSEISSGITTEVKTRTGRFLAVFNFMSFLTAFFIFFLLLRVMHYRHKWLTNERFDNNYLTDDLRKIDLIRARQDKETVLPLNPRERNKYIPLSSVLLVKTEKLKLTKSAVFLSMASLKLGIHMMADYSLYWILETIRYHGRTQTKVQQPNAVGVYVTGEGYLAQIYKSIVKAFSLDVKEQDIDTIPCLPDPLPPDMDRFTQIISLIVISWIMVIFEPYGLRLRQVVMIHYHPDRAKQRATWLYNHILRSRGGFLKFARRQLRRKFGIKGDESVEKVTLKNRLIAMWPILNKCFPEKEKKCLLCGNVEKADKEPHVKCPNLNCVGLFCTQCFADLQNLCPICRSPMDYGDLSDMSEEKDSSEEDVLLSKTEEGKDIIIDEIEKGEKVQIAEDELSYSYQDESPTKVEPIEDSRQPFKDLEAQKIRDDVTTQIFDDSLAEEISLSEESDSPTTCFVIRASRKLGCKSKKKKKKRSPPRRYLSSEEETIIESEDVDTEQLLPTKELDIPCGKTYIENETVKCRRKKKPSVVKKIAKMFRPKDFMFSPLRKKYRKWGKSKNVTSSSSSSSYGDEECKSVLCSGSMELRYPHEKEFPTTELPRYMDGLSRDTVYRQVDETENVETREGDCINVLSDRTDTINPDKKSKILKALLKEENPKKATPMRRVVNKFLTKIHKKEIVAGDYSIEDGNGSKINRAMGTEDDDWDSRERKRKIDDYCYDSPRKRRKKKEVICFGDRSTDTDDISQPLLNSELTEDMKRQGRIKLFETKWRCETPGSNLIDKPRVSECCGNSTRTEPPDLNDVSKICKKVFNAFKLRNKKENSDEFSTTRCDCLWENEDQLFISTSSENDNNTNNNDKTLF